MEINNGIETGSLPQADMQLHVAHFSNCSNLQGTPLPGPVSAWERKLREAPLPLFGLNLKSQSSLPKHLDHLDILAFLVASGALHLNGSLPRSGDPNIQKIVAFMLGSPQKV